MFERVFRAVDPSLVVVRCVEEGSLVAAGATLWTVRGRAR